jgi:hypothetical protein
MAWYSLGLISATAHSGSDFLKSRQLVSRTVLDSARLVIVIRIAYLRETERPFLNSGVMQSYMG